RYVAHDGDECVVLFGLRNGSIGRDDFGPVVRATIELAAGDRLVLVSRHGEDGDAVDRTDSRRSLERTIAAWREWSDTCRDADRAHFGGRWHDQVCRSALALKLLTLPDTGAIAAAATTSLPEEIGGVRNWDYRFCWIRDAAFTAQALVSLGHRAEALDYLGFMSQVCGDQLASGHGPQILYGLHGETDVKERVLEHLEGYRGSRPVRIGNAAAEQMQHDVYGELLGAAYELARIGGEIPADVWSFLSDVTDRAAVAWRYPDAGIWEVRTAPRHHVYSKVMVWVALDRAIRMTERYGMPGNADEWRDARRRVREAVLEEGYDREAGAFVQSFGAKHLDAANLLIPIVGFLPFDDPRVQSTIDRTLEQLTHNGLVYRYLTDDGLPGTEGAFLLTTFWLVDALALSGRMDEASDIFEATAKRANTLGLYAEEYDPRSGAFLGNFPQGFSHIGFINSALYLARVAGRKGTEPAPMGSREHREETGHDPGAAA
ncbi:MAG: glycoside hydrolase family 15 protein, partial [Longimicrobiales bacterium]